MVYKIFDKKTGSGTTNKTEVNVNEVLGHKLDKTMIKKKIEKFMPGFKIIFGLLI